MGGAELAMLARMMGAQQGLGALGLGYENAQKRFGKNYYDPYSQFGDKSLGMLGNALGLNGAAGNDAARRAFQAGPGYQFQMDQGLQALDRSAAAKGMLNSGNHSADLMGYGQGLANQEWSNWLTRIGGGAQMGLSAAAGQTGRQGTLAGIDMSYGTGAANLWNDFGKDMAGMMNGADRDARARAQQRQENLFGGIAGGLNLGLGALSGNLFGVADGMKNAAFGMFGSPLPRGNYFGN